jgi:hypothetical protein
MLYADHKTQNSVHSSSLTKEAKNTLSEKLPGMKYQRLRSSWCVNGGVLLKSTLGHPFDPSTRSAEPEHIDTAFGPMLQC